MIETGNVSREIDRSKAGSRCGESPSIEGTQRHGCLTQCKFGRAGKRADSVRPFLFIADEKQPLRIHLRSQFRLAIMELFV